MTVLIHIPDVMKSTSHSLCHIGCGSPVTPMTEHDEGMTDGVDEHDWLADRFEENRTHLRAVAYPRAITRVGGHPRFPADRRSESNGNVQPADSAIPVSYTHLTL